jgi:hypothetical protein
MAAPPTYLSLDDKDRDYFNVVLADDVERAAWFQYFEYNRTQKFNQRPRNGAGRIAKWLKHCAYWKKKVRAQQNNGQLAVVVHPIGGGILPPPPVQPPAGGVPPIGGGGVLPPVRKSAPPVLGQGRVLPPVQAPEDDGLDDLFGDDGTLDGQNGGDVLPPIQPPAGAPAGNNLPKEDLNPDDQNGSVHETPDLEDQRQTKGRRISIGGELHPPFIFHNDPKNRLCMTPTISQRIFIEEMLGGKDGETWRFATVLQQTPTDGINAARQYGTPSTSLYLFVRLDEHSRIIDVSFNFVVLSLFYS